MASLTSGRGGSMRPTSPARQRPLSTSFSSGSPPNSAESCLNATPRTRRPHDAMRELCSSKAVTWLGLTGTMPSCVNRWVQHDSTDSGAPLDSTARAPLGSLYTTVMRLRSESKGISATNEKPRSMLTCLPRAIFSANTVRATSVGSPSASQRPSSPMRMQELLHSAHTRISHSMTSLIDCLSTAASAPLRMSSLSATMLSSHC
mmetsp:Transcript_10854/g.27432  ORF Transcript_10854/g.27432 Transcript_10854/m.27432 type:complete len:204 (-) Transcript_10854:1677-2288(-)